MAGCSIVGLQRCNPCESLLTLSAVHQLRMNLEKAQKNQNDEYEKIAHANAKVTNAVTHFEKQRARVETEYHKVLK